MSEKRAILFAQEFLDAVKKLRKKYRRIEADIDDFVDQLEQGETIGDRLQGTGDYIIYKARIASRDMQRGKSGGFRTLYYLKTDTQIIMLTIYAKTERADISSIEVQELIRQVLETFIDVDTDDPDSPN